MRQAGAANLLGSYTFNSIADFAAGRAASYSRTLTQPEREGTAWNAAGALAHQWAPSRFFSLLYGARLEAGGFGGAPERKPGARARARRAHGRGVDARPREPARRLLVHVQPRQGQRERHLAETRWGASTARRWGSSAAASASSATCCARTLVAAAAAARGSPGAPSR
jgi:hypothetical protein